MVQHCLGVDQFCYCQSMKCFYLGEKPGQLEEYIVDFVEDQDEVKYSIENNGNYLTVSLNNLYNNLIYIIYFN